MLMPPACSVPPGPTRSRTLNTSCTCQPRPGRACTSARPARAPQFWGWRACASFVRPVCVRSCAQALSARQP